MSGALVALALVHGAAALLVPLPPSAPLVRAAVAPAAASVASYPSPFPVSSVTLTLSNEEAPSCADTCVPEPPYCTYGRGAPASCVLHVPRAQGGLPRGSTLRSTYRGNREEEGVVWYVLPNHLSIDPSLGTREEGVGREGQDRGSQAGAAGMHLSRTYHAHHRAYAVCTPCT